MLPNAQRQNQEGTVEADRELETSLVEERSGTHNNQPGNYTTNRGNSGKGYEHGGYSKHCAHEKISFVKGKVYRFNRSMKVWDLTTREP